MEYWFELGDLPNSEFLLSSLMKNEGFNESLESLGLPEKFLTEVRTFITTMSDRD